MRKLLNWKILFILLSASLLSVICIFPYIITLQGELLRKAGVSVQTLFIAQFIQCLILFSVLIFFGLVLTQKNQFHLPVLEAFVNKKKVKPVVSSFLSKSIILGIVTAIAIYSLDGLFTLLGTQINTHHNAAPVWQTLLAAFYGGITEEIVMRLFLMSLLVWLSTKVMRRKEPAVSGIIVAIMIAAIVFGLGHLPITATLTKIDALVVARAIVLNGIGGIVFGWLFWKKGLEAAMLAHFTTDIFLLTLLPLVLR